VKPYINKLIKHGSFPSLCIGDTHGTILELNIIFRTMMSYLVFEINILQCCRYIVCFIICMYCFICLHMREGTVVKHMSV